MHGFVQEVGKALATVTKIDMCIENSGNSLVTTDILNKEVALLVQACPALTSLSSNFIAPPLMQLLGRACPQITTLNMCESEKAIPISSVRDMMFLQPLLFPHLKVLSLPHFERDFPDLTGSYSLRVLNLCSFIFSDIVEWQRLPPKLEKLQIRRVKTGPPTFTDDGSGRHLLASLTRVGLSLDSFPLHALAQLLQAAPALQAIKDGCDPADSSGHGDQEAEAYIVVDCFRTNSTATDFAILRQNRSLDSIINALYFFDGSNNRVWQPVSADLSLMSGFSSCKFAHCDVAELQQLLRVFPDIRSLALEHLDVYDFKLVQIIPSLSNLAMLELDHCRGISGLGLLAMCLHLTNLCHIRCKGCDQLHAGDLDLCQQLATREVSIVEV